jgi:hypothetical protein
MRFTTDRTCCVSQSPPPPIDPLNVTGPNSAADPCPDLIDDPIVAGLRTLYHEVLVEPVPDEFNDLLAQIDAALDALPADEAEPTRDETENEPSS